MIDVSLKGRKLCPNLLALTILTQSVRIMQQMQHTQHSLIHPSKKKASLLKGCKKQKMIMTNVTSATPNLEVIETEEALLGELLLAPENLPHCENLPVEAFSVSSHRKIYQAIRNVEAQELQPNLNTVTLELRNKGELEDVGGKSKIAQLVGRIVHSINLVEHAKFLINGWKKSQFAKKLKRIGELGSIDSVAAISQAKAIIRELEESSAPEATKIMDAADVARAAGDKPSFDQVQAAVVKMMKNFEDLEDGEARLEWELSMIARHYKMSKKDLKQIIQMKVDTKKKSIRTETEEFLLTGAIEREWIIGGYVPKGTTICLYANGGVGKTLLAYDICKAIAGGTYWNGYPTKQGKVLIVQTDEPEIDIRERLTIADFASLPKGSVHICTDWQFTRMKDLRKFIAEDGYDFVMIDSFSSANRSQIDNEKDASYASKLYDLRDMANEFGCTFMVLHHENKGGGARGTTAIYNNVSEVWHLRKGDRVEGLPLTQRILEPEKSRSGFVTPIKLELNPDDYSWAHLGEIGTEDLGGKLPLGARLLQYMENHRGVKFEPEELRHEFEGATRDAVRMACERAKQKGLLLSEERVKQRETGAIRYKVYYAPAMPETQPEIIDAQVADVQVTDVQIEEPTPPPTPTPTPTPAPTDTRAKGFVPLASKPNKAKESAPTAPTVVPTVALDNQPKVGTVVTINAGSKNFDGAKAIVIGYVEEEGGIAVHVKLQISGTYNGYDLYYKSEFLEW